MSTALYSGSMVPTRESERLELVQELGLLDSDPDPSFDALTELASRVCNTPIALLSLVDEDRQFFASRLGVAFVETPRSLSFCAHAISPNFGGGIFEVSDTLLDIRFRKNDLVLGEPHIRFYAGVPLRPTGGDAVGTLCVLGDAPSELTPFQRDELLRLAGIAEQLLRLRLLVRNEGELVERAETSERYYRYLADHITDVVVVHDIELNRKYKSPNFAAFFGYTRAEIDEFPADHRFIDAGDRPIRPGTRVVFSQEIPRQTLRATGRRKDGSSMDLSLDVLGIFEGETLVEYRTTVRDIGGLVQKENELQKVNNELLAAEIRRSHAVRNLTHDLAAPLAAIRITAESVREQIPESPLRVQVEHLVAFAEQAQALVSDLRVVNDPDGDDPTLVLAEHNLATLVGRAAILFSGGVKSVAVFLELDDVTAWVDQRALSRILSNVMTNAIVHNPAGTSVTVRLFESDGDAVVTVEDDGVGIEVAERVRVLEPYVALDLVGSGLGLAIADALVGAHGGTLRIAGNERSGTTVRISVPLRPS